MFVSGGAFNGKVGRQGDVGGDSLPHELEGIRSKPHVLAAAGDGVGLLRSVVFGTAGVKNGANVAVVFKEPDWRSFLRAGDVGHSQAKRTDSGQQQSLLWAHENKPRCRR